MAPRRGACRRFAAALRSIGSILLVVLALAGAHTAPALGLPAYEPSTTRLRFCSEVTRRAQLSSAASQGIDLSDAKALAGIGSQCDCILVESADADGTMRYGLIDTGRDYKEGDGRTMALAWLQGCGIDHLDWMIVTHMHSDHMGAVESIVSAMPVGRLYVKHYDPVFSKYYERHDDGAFEIVDGGANGYIGILRACVEHGVPIVGISWAEVDLANPAVETLSPGLAASQAYAELYASWDVSEAQQLFLGAFDEGNVAFQHGSAELELVNWEEYDERGGVWTEGSSIPHEWVYNENKNSMGVLVRNGATTAFLAGDIEGTSESGAMKLANPGDLGDRAYHREGDPEGTYRIIAQAGDLTDEERLAQTLPDVDLLKAGHHGYNSSSKQVLLDAIQPEAVMITNTKDNAAEAVRKRLQAMGCIVLYTTEDPVETVADLGQNSVAMGLASEDQWRFERQLGAIAPYRVEHVVEGSAEPFATDELQGAVGAVTSAEARALTGYAASTISQTFIRYAGDTVVTIGYSPISYAISFDANAWNARGEMADQPMTYDEASALDAATFTRPGCLFDGWNTEPDGSGESFADCQEVSNLAAEEGSTVTLYAQWKSFPQQVEPLARHEDANDRPDAAHFAKDEAAEAEKAADHAVSAASLAIALAHALAARRRAHPIPLRISAAAC